MLCNCTYQNPVDLFFLEYRTFMYHVLLLFTWCALATSFVIESHHRLRQVKIATLLLIGGYCLTTYIESNMMNGETITGYIFGSVLIFIFGQSKPITPYQNFIHLILGWLSGLVFLFPALEALNVI